MFIALQHGEYAMPKHTVRKRTAHTNGSEAKGKYVVEIDRTEQNGELKRVPFRQRDAALRLAELIVRKRNSKVRVLNPNGFEIFPC
jgi:hypothetical protein